MPELPEVETMVRDLEPRLVNRTIAAVDAPFPGIIRWPDLAAFARGAEGTRITGITRRGKYASLQLDSGASLIIHRGMSGSLLLRCQGDAPESHVRLSLRLDDGHELRLNDPRKFGSVYLMDGARPERPAPWSEMGPEPLDDAFTPERLAALLARRTGLIKPLLLNQRVVAGLGNIYVDEALHRARIHPMRRAGSLRPGEIRALHGAIQGVLTEAIENRGTTFNSYMDVEGRQGGFQGALRVFGRQGSPCVTCGTPLVKIVVGGRGTHLCPRCQRAPR